MGNFCIVYSMVCAKIKKIYNYLILKTYKFYGNSFNSPAMPRIIYTIPHIRHNFTADSPSSVISGHLAKKLWRKLNNKPRNNTKKILDR